MPAPAPDITVEDSSMYSTMVSPSHPLLHPHHQCEVKMQLFTVDFFTCRLQEKIIQIFQNVAANLFLIKEIIRSRHSKY